MGRNEFINARNAAIPVFFFLLCLMLAVRKETIGRDLSNYKFYFKYYGAMELDRLLTIRSQFLFAFLNWVAARLSSSFQVYLAIVAVITTLPIAYVYQRDRTHSILKILLFVNMSTFVLLFSGLRQYMAIAMGMIAYSYVQKKKIGPFLIMVFIGMAFHHSGFMLLTLYPLYHIKLRKRHMFTIIPAIVAVFLFNKQIFGLLTRVFSEYSDKYQVDATSTGAYGSLILFILFAVFCYVIPEESEMDAETLGLRNYLLMAVVLQCFAPIHSLAMRLNYYYIIFIPMVMAKVLNYPKQRFKQIAKLAEIVLCLFFAVDYLYTTYVSSITGISLLDTVPYVPFWK